MNIRNIKKISTTKKILLTVALLLLVIIITAGTYYLLHRNANPQASHSGVNVIDSNPATSTQRSTGNTIKSNAASGTSSDSPPNPVTQANSSQRTVQLSVTSKNQTPSVYQIRSLISAVTDTGTCTLTLTKTSETTVTMTAGIQAQATTSTCKGFDVPLSQLSTGTWQLTLTFGNTTLFGSTTSTITVT